MSKHGTIENFTNYPTKIRNISFLITYTSNKKSKTKYFPQEKQNNQEYQRKLRILKRLFKRGPSKNTRRQMFRLRPEEFSNQNSIATYLKEDWKNIHTKLQ